MEIFLLPETWIALVTLIALELVLGIDNLIFISIATSRLPEHLQPRIRRLGISLALLLRLMLLFALSWVIGLTEVVFDLGLSGDIDIQGVPTFETAFSWRDIILIAGGAFLVWKATAELHHVIDPEPQGGVFETPTATGVAMVIGQIVLLDVVFSVDSILTAVGMTNHLPIMIIAVVVTVGLMLVAADPLSKFVTKNPTVVVLALAFLLSIGILLVADGFGRHIPKGYVYVAIGFAIFVEGLNILARNRMARRIHKPDQARG